MRTGIFGGTFDPPHIGHLILAGEAAFQLKLDRLQLTAARQQLELAGLIAYQKPLYQVLALPEPSPEPVVPTAPRSGQVQCVGDILRRVLAGGPA